MLLREGQQALKEATRIISRGGIIAFRTDTFYGLGVDPLNQNAIQAIRKLKSREEAKPILLLLSDASEVRRFVASPSELFTTLAKRFWPGPLTLIGDARPDLPVELTAGTGTIGVRLPDDERVRELVRACGGALTATSANVSGGAPARTAREVQAHFSAGLDLILDGGEVTATEASTVVDVTGTKLRVVREGPITRADLERTFSQMS